MPEPGPEYPTQSEGATIMVVMKQLCYTTAILKTVDDRSKTGEIAEILYEKIQERWRSIQGNRPGTMEVPWVQLRRMVQATLTECLWELGE